MRSIRQKTHAQAITWLAVVLWLSATTSSTVAHGPIQTEPQVIDISTFPPIEQDIAALANYGNAARQAGARLVERGYDALNYLHTVLLDPNATFPQKMQLITVLGEIGETGSVEYILKVANESADNRYLYQNTLLALARFEQTDEVIEFVDKQLEQTNRDPLIQRSALAYYAQKPTIEATHWVDVYAAPDVHPDVRYAALYLGGTLGMDSVKDDIVDVLQSKQKNTREYYLLLGLAAITTPEEFSQLTDRLELNAENLAKAKQYNRFRKGDTTKKNELAKAFLEKGDIAQKRAAVDYLTDKQDAEALANSWNSGDSYVRSSLRRSGYEIEESDEGVQFKELEREPKQKDFNVMWLVILLVVILALSAILYKQHLPHGSA